VSASRSSRFGIEPDVLLLSKAIGGGLPLGVVVYDAALDVWPAGTHAGTFRGNQLALATGAAALRFMRLERLELHARAMGERLNAASISCKRATHSSAMCAAAG